MRGNLHRLDPSTWDTRDLEALMEANGRTAGPAAHGTAWSTATQFPVSAFVVAAVALEAGGTAADAFVAAALTDIVVTPGASSLGGALDLLVKEPQGEVVWLDALYRVPLREIRHDTSDWKVLTTTGRSVLVPGMLRGLEGLWQRYGRLAWSELFVPARWFAERGFPAYPRLAQLVEARRDLLLSDPGAGAAYLPEGRPVAPGEFVRNPQLAETLATAAEGGADSLYLGEWGEALVAATVDRGGVLQREDVRGYDAEWRAPLSVRYIDHTVYAGGATTTATSLVRAVAVCRALGMDDLPVREQSGETLYAEMQADAYSWEPPIWHHRDDAEAAARLAEALSPDGLERVAALIRSHIPAGSAGPPPGTHAIAVMDADGLAVSGAHSISWAGWGSGIFVGGVPLNAAGYHLIDRPVVPGLPALGTHSGAVMAVGTNQVVAAAGTNHHLSCSLQCLNDVVGHGIPVVHAVARPRWGGALFDLATGTNTPHLHAECAIPQHVIAEAVALGQAIKRQDGTALGYWTAVAKTGQDLVAIADPRFRGASFAS